MALLKVENITKIFPGVKALKSVSLEYDKGEVHAMVGENGAGKTTLMRVITGIYEQDEGDIYFEGEKVRFHNTRESQDKGIAIIHQELNMPVNLTIAEYIYLGRLPVNKLGLVKRKEAAAQCRSLLDTVEIDRPPTTKISELTVAEQQLVEIAKALSLNSKLIIMDEPFVGLDPKASHTLKGMMREHCNQGGAIFFSTHVLEVAEKLCDKVAIIKKGRLVASGTMDEVRGQDSLEDVFLELEGENA